MSVIAEILATVVSVRGASYRRPGARLAEILTVLHGRPGGPLRDRPGPIHG